MGLYSSEISKIKKKILEKTVENLKAEEKVRATKRELNILIASMWDLELQEKHGGI